MVDQIIKDPNWLVGFTTAEGCFLINISASKTKVEERVYLRFSITQHSRELQLMNNLVKYLDCGKLREVVGRPAVYRVVDKISDIDSKIVPLFTNSAFCVKFYILFLYSI